MEFQHLFHRYWQHLQDPHVRALAWMLTSPDMLSQRSPVWEGNIGTIPIADPEALIAWLSELDRQPAPLHQALAVHKHTRLGHYAEKLLAFYLQHQGTLFAHGLQVHQYGVNTIGEFDFLVRQRMGLMHWELATKFYLYDGEAADPAAGLARTRAADLYDFVGPNLADTLGGKMKKLIGQQLALSRHPIAQTMTKEAVYKAQAVVKGWLFYRHMAQSDNIVEAIAPGHCRGFWWLRHEVDRLAIKHALILPRLQWLAPAQVREEEAMGRASLLEALDKHFQNDSEPVMIAILRRSGDWMQEMFRGMVVSDDWQQRHEARRAMLRDPLL